MLSMTMDEQGEHIFMSDGSRCDHGEPLALTREGKIDYFFELPFGPSAMCTRDGNYTLSIFIMASSTSRTSGGNGLHTLMSSLSVISINITASIKKGGWNNIPGEMIPMKIIS